VRRFCEHFMDDIHRVAFVVTDPGDEAIYLALLPLYFPRNKHEELYAMANLPEETGNEWGESFIPERQIRIATIPGLDSPASEPSGGSTLPYVSPLPVCVPRRAIVSLCFFVFVCSPFGWSSR
jgi:hypothetical protein